MIYDADSSRQGSQQASRVALLCRLPPPDQWQRRRPCTSDVGGSPSGDSPSGLTVLRSRVSGRNATGPVHGQRDPMAAEDGLTRHLSHDAQRSAVPRKEDDGSVPGMQANSDRGCPGCLHLQAFSAAHMDISLTS